MANKILTPITLWNDFNDSLPVNEQILSEQTEEKSVLRKVRFSGRSVGETRVDIFALFGMPAEGNSVPALLVLPDCDHTADIDLIRRFVKKGYAVLMPDYRGRSADSEGTEYTIYPEEIAYANYEQAGKHMDYAEPSAVETSWYEWVAVARYCVRYLRSNAQISKIGVIGLKAGGDIAWQLAATSEELSCVIPVCAGGWRAYRGIYKFGDSAAELKMDDERYRFLAGVDSQAYAQYVKCPVLMLCSTNDERFDADRAFDTFARINPQQDKTFYFAVRYNGKIGNTGMNDLDLFADKYLKSREVFIPSPAEISIEEDDGELVAKIRSDRNGEMVYCEVFMAEDCADSSDRDWTRCAFKRETEENEQVFRLDAYKGSSRVFAFAKAKYSCGFAVSSKIAVKKIEKPYTNLTDKSRILYSSVDKFDSFVLDKPDKNVLADCFLDSSLPPVSMADGPFGIQGIYSSYGLRLYRINDPKFRPEQNALLKMDLYSAKSNIIRLCILAAKNGVSEKYYCNLKVTGGEYWADRVLSPKDFKTEENKALMQFSDAVFISFSSDEPFCLNNLLWI